MGTIDSEIEALAERLRKAELVIADHSHKVSEIPKLESRVSNVESAVHEIDLISDRHSNKLELIHGILIDQANERKEARKEAKKAAVGWIQWIPAIGGFALTVFAFFMK